MGADCRQPPGQASHQCRGRPDQLPVGAPKFHSSVLNGAGLSSSDPTELATVRDGYAAKKLGVVARKSMV
jgi:hypothetical protein